MAFFTVFDDPTSFTAAKPHSTLIWQNDLKAAAGNAALVATADQNHAERLAYAAAQFGLGHPGSSTVNRKAAHAATWFSTGSNAG